MTVLPPDMQRLRAALLRQAGFEDLEDARGNIEPLIKSHGAAAFDPGRYAADEFDALAEYYRAAGQFLWDRQWANTVERRVWELHADGASYTRITRTVRREMMEGRLPAQAMYRRRAHSTVTRLRALMLGLRHGRPRGRPRDPGGCYRGGPRLELRLPDAVAAALARICEHTGQGEQDAIRWVISEVDKRLTGRGGQ